MSKNGHSLLAFELRCPGDVSFLQVSRRRGGGVLWHNMDVTVKRT